MKLVELILDEEALAGGVEAISIVKNPAIESNFVAFREQAWELKAADKEKRILLGALLVPNKPIPRHQMLNGKMQKFNCFFSPETIEKASQLYLKKGNQNNSTLEHQLTLQGLSLVESWIKVDEVHDKSLAYGLKEPVGTWFGAVHVENEDIWNDWVKTGKVLGFSIEGFFADRSVNMTAVDPAAEMMNEIKKVITEYHEKQSRKH